MDPSPDSGGGGGKRRKAKKPARDSGQTSSTSSGVRLRRRRRAADGDVQDLGLPLGMSFAAVLAKVLDGKNASPEKMHVHQLSQICTSAVKESLEIIYGERFDHFMRNFEKSFGSTLMTLRLINEASTGDETSYFSEGQENAANCTSFVSSNWERADVLGASGSSGTVEELKEDPQVSSLSSQLILHGQVSQLAHVSRDRAGPKFNQSILDTFEKSVVEQSRSNDLKAVEIGLVMRKLEMKQSQLALSSYANYLDKIKICMGISKASFKEEKLRNQMQDMRNAELLRRCNDLLVSGIVFMVLCLSGGVYVYSPDRIKEATSSCSSSPKEQPKWWKPVSAFTSTSYLLRCQAQVYTRMLFGIVVILAVIYLLFQRSAITGPSMPVTYIIVLLGAVCGIAGKFSVDTFGGSGSCWLLYWEALCLLHFLANIFPSLLYYILYGPVLASREPRTIIVPYRLRRCMFYIILMFILPALCGMLPFASLRGWKDYFTGSVPLANIASIPRAQNHNSPISTQTMHVLHYLGVYTSSIMWYVAIHIIIVPYRLRLRMFYIILVFILPALCGMLPFASLRGWKDYFTGSLPLANIASEDGD